MPKPAPQKNAPSQNKGTAQIQGKNPPEQRQQSNAKSAPQKNAPKPIEHFNADPPKKNTPVRQMPAARREQMVREIDIYVQMVYETLVREAQSNGGNPAVLAVKTDKAAKVPALKGKNFVIDVNKLEKSDNEKGTVMGTWSKEKNGAECGHPQVPHDLHAQFGRLCMIAEGINPPLPAKGKVPKKASALPSAKGTDPKRPGATSGGKQPKQR